VRVSANYDYQGEYRLRVTTVRPPGQMESENNDSIANANTLTLFTNGPTRNATVAGYIHLSGNLDYFNLGTVEPGESIFLKVRLPSTSQLGPVVSVYSAAGVYLPEAPGGRAFDGVAEVRVSQRGTYYAVVRGGQATAALEAQYLLDVQVRPTGSLNFPNLQVTGITLPTGSPIVSGQAIAFTYTVRNVGTFMTPVPAWSDRVVMSLDAVLGNGDDLPLGTFPHLGALSVDGSYTATQTAVLPEGISGDYYLIVQTDARNNVDEYLLEGDNTTVSDSTFAVVVAPYPDLVVEGASVTGLGAPRTFRLSWNTANRGDRTNSGPWSERVYLRNLATGVPVIDTERIVTNTLAPNASFAQSLDFSLAGIGPYQAIVITDFRNQVFEFNTNGHASAELNNNAQVRFDLTLDLQVTNLTLMPGSGLESGNTVTIHWQTTNSGAYPSEGSWYDRVRIVSTNTGETLLDTAVYYSGVSEGSISPGEFRARQYSFRLPDGPRGVGVLEISVTCDSQNNLFEHNLAGTAELNNSAWIRRTSAPALYSDLVPTAFAAVGSPSGGRTISLIRTVRNQGEGRAQPPWDDYVYLSTSNVWTPQATWLASLSESQPLPIGADYTRTNTLTLPTRPQGDYYLILRVDGGNSLYETNEANNEMAVAIRFPDSLSAPDAVLGGGTNQLPALGSLDFSPNGAMLVAAGGSRAYLWSVQTRDLKGQFAQHTASIDSVDFSPLGDQVLTGARDGTARIWDAATLQQVRSFPAASGQLTPTAFSEDGARVLVASGQNTAKLWATMSSNLLATLTGHAGAVSAVALSPDNSKAITGSSDRRVILWNTALATPLFVWTNHTHLINAVKFSPSGTNALTASSDGTIRIWDVTSGAELRVLRQGSAVSSAVFSGDGRYVVSCDNGWPGMAFLWDVATGELLRTFSETGENPSSIGSVAITPDRTFIATSHSDGQVRLWGTGLDPLALPQITPLPIGSELPLTLRSHGLYYFEIDAPASQNIVVTVDARPSGGSGVLKSFTKTTTGISEDARFANRPEESPRQSGRGLKDGDISQPPLGFDLAAIRLTATKGRLPSVYEFEHYAQAPLSNIVAELPFATTTPGKYYVLVYSPYLSAGAVNARVRADFNNFHLSGVIPNRAGNAGNITATVQGTGLTGDTVITLAGPGGAAVTGQTVLYVDTTRRFVTFDLRGSAPGQYALQAKRSDFGTITLNNAFEVTGGTGPRLEARLVAPAAARPGRSYGLTLEYANVGDADMAAPLFVVSTPGPWPVLFPISSSAAAPVGTGVPTLVRSVQVLGINQNGPPGVLPPGARFQLPLRFQTPPAGQSVSFNLEVLRADETPIVWSELESQFRPADMAADLWAALWSNFKSAVGSTWADYLRSLDNQANLLALAGQPSYDVADLLASLFSEAVGTSYRRTLFATVDASASAPALPLQFARFATDGLEHRFSLGPLGRGWSHHFECSLTQPTNNVVIIRTPGGGGRRFDRGSDNVWRGQAGDYATLAVGAGWFVLTEKDGLARQFDGSGLLVSIEEPNQNRVTLSYSGSQLTGLAHSAGPNFTLQYSGQGRLARLTDHAGQVTDYEYDPAGEHLLRVISPGAVTNSYTYQPVVGSPSDHALASITFPDGAHQFFTWNSMGRLAEQSRDGGEERLQFSYSSGGVVSVRDDRNAVTTLRLGERGQLLQMTDALGHGVTFNYDSSYNLTRLTGPAGDTTEMAYDAQGNASRVINPLAQTVTLNHTGFSRLDTLRDARNQLTDFGYDSRGNLTSIAYPDTSAEQFGYDPAGSVSTWQNRRGQTVQFARNAQGQLLRKTYPDGRTIDYRHDARGLLTNVTDSVQGVTTLSYDSRGFLTAIAYPDGKGFAFDYNAAGRRTRRVGHDGYTLNYGYDSVGRLETLTDGASRELVRYAYDLAGRLFQETKGNGTFTTYTYDIAGQLTALTNHVSLFTFHSFFNYTYDAKGNRLTMTTAAGLTSYDYDALNQLTGVTYPGGRHVTYAYDAAGNRTFVNDTGVNTAYIANALNQYTQVGAATFGYDLDGNMTQRTDATGTTTYDYDTENRLVRVATPTNGVFHYTYDALGNRTTVVHDGVTNRFLHDPVGLVDVAAEYDATGDLVSRYDHAIGLVSRTDGAGNSAFYSFDALGNTRELTGDAGAVLNSYDYDAFGAAMVANETVGNGFRFVGRFGVAHEQTGMHFMRARYYDQDVGRFMAADPAGVAGGINLQTYCANNPLVLIDPDGLRRIWVEVRYRPLGTQPPWIPIAKHRHFFVKESPSSTDVLYDIGLLTTKDNYLGWRIGPDDPSMRDRYQGTYGTGFWAEEDDFWRAMETVVEEYQRSNRHYETLDPFHNVDCWDFVNDVTATVVRPIDPNDKIGPTGVGPNRVVSAQDELEYMIRFENFASASAPVQELIVVDYLDAGLDWTTVCFKEIAYGDRIVTPPVGSQSFTVRDLPPTNSVSITGQTQGRMAVDVSASFNPQTGRLEWRALAVDTATEDFPEDALAGFLPNGSEIGRNGYVTFSVKPKANLPIGTGLTNKANIIFDFEDPIDTPAVWNTIGDIPPTLAMSIAYLDGRIVVGSNFTYTVTVTNSGPGNASIVVVTNLLPPGMELVSATSSRGNYSVSNGVLVCTVGDLTNGGSATFTITLLPTNEMVFTNFVIVSSRESWTTGTGPVSYHLFNSAPWLAAVSNRVVDVNAQLVITNTAADFDTPAQTLTFSLAAGSPEGATINPTNGVFRWQPTPAQASTTNLITVRVTDSGFPAVSSSRSFTVVVKEYLAPSLGQLVLRAGDSGLIPLQVYSSVGVNALNFRLDYPPGRLTNFLVGNLAPEIAVGYLRAISATNSMINLTNYPGQPLIGTKQIGFIGFTAVSNQHSAFVPLSISEVQAVKPDGTVVSNVAFGVTRVVVVGEEPLLEALLSSTRQRMMTIYGQPGTTNVIESNPDLAGLVPWSADPAFERVVLTNLFQTLPSVSTTNRMIFFRAWRVP
jgi:RHS repeat-associated protein/uncharacterized repeat protein (TIGR01451 family)